MKRLSVSFFIVMWFVLQEVGHAMNATFFVDMRIAEVERERIARLLGDHLCRGMHTHAAGDWYAVLKDICPVVASISCRKQPLRYEIVVSAYNPLFVVNDSLMFSEGEHLIPLSFYDEETVAAVDRVKVAPSALHSVDLIRDLCALRTAATPQLFESFDLVFKSPTMIEFRERASEISNDPCSVRPHFVITAHQFHMPNEQEIAWCRKIYNEIAATDRVRATSDIVTDIRFDHRIVASVRERGVEA